MFWSEESKGRVCNRRMALIKKNKNKKTFYFNSGGVGGEQIPDFASEGVFFQRVRKGKEV